MRPLFDDAEVGVTDAKWSPDGQTLYVATDLGREFVGVHALDPASGNMALLTGCLDVNAIDVLADIAPWRFS